MTAETERVADDTDPNVRVATRQGHDPQVIEIPVPGLVVLIGAAGAGKSTLATRLFDPAEVVSSDALREALSGDPADQRATRPAFAILHREVGRRLAASRLVVVDATNVERAARAPLLRAARNAGVPAIAIVIMPVADDVRARNASRPGRVVPPHVVDRHLAALARLGSDPETTRRRLLAEGFLVAHILASASDLDTLGAVRRVRVRTILPGAIGGDPSAAAVLDDLVSELVGVLGDGLVGAYLMGSAVAGGYDPGLSDLDLVVVTSHPVETLDLHAIDDLHRRVKARNASWDDRLEIVYIGRAALAAFRTTGGSLAMMSPGEPFHVRSERPIDWLQNWYLLRVQSHTLVGPLPTSLLGPIEWAAFTKATTRYASGLAALDLAGATPGGVAYTLLTMCRAAATIALARTVSKQEGAAWAAAAIPAFRPLIDEGLRCRRSGGVTGFAGDTDRAGVALLLDTLARRIADLAAGAPSQ